MKTGKSRSHIFFFILIMLMVAIICYQEPSNYPQAHYAKELIEDSSLGQSTLAELKFLKLIVEKVFHVVR